VEECAAVNQYPDDIFSEPAEVDVDTLRKLGPLRALGAMACGRAARGAGIRTRRGRSEAFHHTDRSTLVRIGEPTPNPLARE
jgi:hypothetical protein